MSHFTERKEKNCLNCNAEVAGRYCHICGQENVEIEESFFQLAAHLVYDIFHYDGKFWKTVKVLLLKPGFLTKEYIRGKRASYLHPVRMYVFASAVFFLVLFGFIIKKDAISHAADFANPETLAQNISRLNDSLKTVQDSATRKEIQAAIDSLSHLNMAGGNIKLNISGIDSSNNKSEADSAEEKLPATIEAYKKQQDSLPEEKRDNRLTSLLNQKQIIINSKYKGDQEKFTEDLIENILHTIPQMMFVTLPLIALVLWLLYVRRRKEFFYVDHIVMMAHTYIAIFTGLLIIYGMQALHSVLNWEIFDLIKSLISIYLFLYCYLAMKNFYRQGYIKTFFKYMILLFISSFIFAFVALAFIAKSFLQM